MFNGRSFTTTILSLSFILMITIIKASRGSTGVCNGTIAECQVFNKDEQESLMDTQEHRQILEITYTDGLTASDGNNGKKISYQSFDSNHEACGNNCNGKGVIDVANRCQNNQYSCKYPDGF